jgi:hypothetical protein
MVSAILSKKLDELEALITLIDKQEFALRDAYIKLEYIRTILSGNSGAIEGHIIPRLNSLTDALHLFQKLSYGDQVRHTDKGLQGTILGTTWLKSFLFSKPRLYRVQTEEGVLECPKEQLELRYGFTGGFKYRFPDHYSVYVIKLNPNVLN